MHIRSRLPCLTLIRSGSQSIFVSSLWVSNVNSSMLLIFIFFFPLLVAITSKAIKTIINLNSNINRERMRYNTMNWETKGICRHIQQYINTVYSIHFIRFGLAWPGLTWLYKRAREQQKKMTMMMKTMKWNNKKQQ